MNMISNEDRLKAVASEFEPDGEGRTSKSKDLLWTETYAKEIELFKNMVVHRNNRIFAHSTGGTKILDIGCGFGDILYLMRDKYNELYGIDPSMNMVGQCINNLKIRSVKNQYTIAQGVAECTDFEDNTFDTVTMTDVFEHIKPEHRINALIEVKRILSNKGQLILVTPSKYHILFFSIIDNILSIPFNIINNNKIPIFAHTQKDYTEIFCNKNELYRSVDAAGLVVNKFERVGFYPSPERPGFLGRRLKSFYYNKYYSSLKNLFIKLERLEIFNQKMLINCTIK